MNYKASIITISDKGSVGERVDLSKIEIEKVLNNYNFDIVYYNIIPDEFDLIKNELNKCVDMKINLVLTTGGTGFSKRDVTPEATKSVIEKETPGIPEYMRLKSCEFTSRSILSRSVCGIKDESVILNLPGSPKACKENLEFVIEPLIHGIDTLLGISKECARK